MCSVKFCHGALFYFARRRRRGRRWRTVPRETMMSRRRLHATKLPSVNVCRAGSNFFERGHLPTDFSISNSTFCFYKFDKKKGIYLLVLCSCYLISLLCNWLFLYVSRTFCTGWLRLPDQVRFWSQKWTGSWTGGQGQLCVAWAFISFHWVCVC